jgi:hypothetical protein
MSIFIRFRSIVLAAIFSLSLLLAIPSSVSAAFNKSLLMGDAIFDQKNSMSSSQIDAFLNSFAYSCISTNSKFQARVPSGYNPTSGYSYGNYGTAGQVIAAAAQAYDVNPRVLIVTLEKEQSLVTGQNSSSYCKPSNDNNHKYAAAVGYGCPDGGAKYNYTGVDLYRRNGTTQTSVGPTCVNNKSKAGFSQQVIRGAWLLKFGQQRSRGNIGWAIIKGSWDNSDDPQSCYAGPMTRGTWQTCPSGPTVYYDGYRTIDGSATLMGSGATAALYWYTPHFHGNQVFVSVYENWFGLTTVDYFKDMSISGDWDGNGTTTLGIKRGNTYYLDNNNDGKPDSVIVWGRSTDQAISGDWDGNGTTTLGIKRGNTYYLDNNNDGKPDLSNYYLW